MVEMLVDDLKLFLPNKIDTVLQVKNPFVDVIQVDFKLRHQSAVFLCPFLLVDQVYFFVLQLESGLIIEEYVQLMLQRFQLLSVLVLGVFMVDFCR
jgi:hypothetical protein